MYRSVRYDVAVIHPNVIFGIFDIFKWVWFMVLLMTSWFHGINLKHHKKNEDAKILYIKRELDKKLLFGKILLTVFKRLKRSCRPFELCIWIRQILFSIPWSQKLKFNIVQKWNFIFREIDQLFGFLKSV